MLQRYEKYSKFILCGNAKIKHFSGPNRLEHKMSSKICNLLSETSDKFSYEIEIFLANCSCCPLPIFFENMEKLQGFMVVMGKNPHCSDSILFGLGSIPISKDILVWPTCRSIYVIGDVIADALGVDDVMSVTSRAFQPSGQPLTQRVQGPFTMKADARRRGRRRVARADVDVERDRGHAAGRRGRRGDRVHLAEHPRGWSCTLETRPKFCR